MNVVTVMNYEWNDINYLLMCCNWIKHAKIHLRPEDSCLIFCKNKPHALLDYFIGQDSRFRFCIRKGLSNSKDVFFSLCGNKGSGENLTYKLFVVCSLNIPFLFIDADTLILDKIEELESLFQEGKPAIFIDHELDIEGHTNELPFFINSGVFIVNDPSKAIMNWNQLWKHAVRSGFYCCFKGEGKQIPGTDQAVIKSYFDKIGYQYKHERFGTNYNNCADRVTFFKVDDFWRVKNHKGENVKILHYWGPFKPWSISCPIFKELKDDKVFNRHNVLDKS